MSYDCRLVAWRRIVSLHVIGLYCAALHHQWRNGVMVRASESRLKGCWFDYRNNSEHHGRRPRNGHYGHGHSTFGRAIWPLMVSVIALFALKMHNWLMCAAQRPCFMLGFLDILSRKPHYLRKKRCMCFSCWQRSPRHLGRFGARSHSGIFKTS